MVNSQVNDKGFVPINLIVLLLPETKTSYFLIMCTTVLLTFLKPIFVNSNNNLVV